MDSKDYKKYFCELPADEKIRVLYRAGVPSQIKGLDGKYIYPIKDAVRTQGKVSLTRQEIRDIISDFSPEDKRVALEARNQINQRAKDIAQSLEKLNLGRSYHRRAVILGIVDRVNDELKYKNYYTGVTPTKEDKEAF